MLISNMLHTYTYELKYKTKLTKYIEIKTYVTKILSS